MTDWIQVITIAVMIICVTVAVQYYFNMNVKTCIDNPLVYSAKYYSDKFGQEFYGVGRFRMNGSSPIIINFDSDGVNVEREGQDPSMMSYYNNNWTLVR
jgi:hypothetical protein